MKKKMMILAFLLFLTGCSTEEKNAYENEDTETIDTGIVKFEVPESWESEENRNFSYYFENDRNVLSLQTMDVMGSNSMLLEKADELVEAIKETDSSIKDEEVDIVNVSGIEAVEMTANVKMGESEALLKTLTFISKSKRYHFSYYSKGDREKSIDEFESLKNSIELLLPKKIELEEGNIYLSDIYFEGEETDYGHEGWIIIKFDMSEMSEDQKYWIEKEYDFDLEDNSDKSDEEYIHLKRIYKSRILENGEKYIFASIEESKNPLSEMKLDVEIKAWCFQKPSSYTEINEDCSIFGVYESISPDVEKIMIETMERYL